MLNISIVLYHPDWENEVNPLVQELLKVQSLHHLYLVDNSPTSTFLAGQDKRVQYIFVGKNLGYGRAHNIALRKTTDEKAFFHLVLNSDILLHAEDIDAMCAYMELHPKVGQMMPKVVCPNGETQYLCKLLPSPLDVFGRRFLPNKWIAKRNAQYELRQSGYDKIMNVPYLSGCFMLLRAEAVQQVGYFDERYFMYPEDIDLTRRIHRDYLTLFYPYVTIVHNHTRGSYHTMRLLWIHIVNMCRYFNKWGWFCDKERTQFNQATLSSIGK